MIPSKTNHWGESLGTAGFSEFADGASFLESLGSRRWSFKSQSCMILRLLIMMVAYFIGLPVVSAVTPAEAKNILSQFEKLNPPFDTLKAKQAFGSADWVDTADLHHVTMLGGLMLISLDRGGQIFYINLVSDADERKDWWIELRTTNDINSESALRSFLRGKGKPHEQILEYVLCAPKKIARAGRENLVPD